MTPLEMNLEAYRLIYEVEVAVREFLIARCEPIMGPAWWREVLERSQAAKLERVAEPRKGAKPADQRAKDDGKHLSSRRAFHPVYWVDFPELGRVFQMNSNKQKLAEHLVSRNAKAIHECFELLQPIRNAVAHNRPIDLADLDLARSVHATVRSELGLDAFATLCNKPNSIAEMRQEMAELLAELKQAGHLVQNAKELQLPVWERLQTRWWLEPEWQVDAKSVVEAFALLVAYRQMWSSDFLGRNRRVTDWREERWSEITFRRAQASLSRELDGSTG
jgi:hypothetical protein